MLLAALAARPTLASAGPSRRVLIIHEFAPTEAQLRRHARWFKEDGWVVGENLSLEYVNLVVLKDPQLVEKRAREIVASKPDAIMIESDHVFLFQRLTKDIPLVFANFCCDAVRLGFVQSLGRPGGNITGTALPSMDKSWEVAKALRPKMKRIAILMNDDVPEVYLKDSREMGRAVAARLELQAVEIVVPRDAKFADVERAIRNAKVDAVDVGIGEDISWEPELIRFLERAGIIGLWSDAPAVKQGGLIAVHADGARGFLEAIQITGRILRGGTPAGIPVQIVRTIHISINLRTAKTMGIEVPASVLTLADIVFK